MCGIIGYIGARPVTSVLLDALKRMEYRGYDSAGVSVATSDGLRTVRECGVVASLEAKNELHELDGSIGIGHTRWATHGEPSERNAHPHSDCKGKVSIVHNGIIENAEAIKTFLKKEGHELASDTDSEVIAHLIEKFYKGDLVDAVRQTIEILEGAFGLAILHADEDIIVAARRGSPIIVGIGEGEFLVASDLTAIIPYTKRVVYVQDEEIVALDRKGIQLFSKDGAKLSPVVDEVKMSIENIQKGNYKHYMLKEINEQPLAIENTLRGRITEKGVKLSVAIPKDLRRVVVVGCGTSWHAGLIGKYLIERLSGVPCDVDYASEFRYRDPLLNSSDLVVAISQSGETADTLAAIREAKARGAHTTGLVNVVGSTIAREVESGIYLHAGPEIGVASTKAFSCQVVALTLLALKLREERGLPPDMETLASLAILPDAVREVLRNADEMIAIAEHYKDAKNFLFLGRGINFPVALEGALKLKEISYIHAEGYPAAEMKHGPIALVDKEMPVCFVAPRDHTYEKILSNMEEIKARGGRVLVITSEPDARMNRLAEHVIVVPHLSETLSPLLTVIPLQVFAYAVADAKHLPVDRPRNLAKSVTVE